MTPRRRLDAPIDSFMISVEVAEPGQADLDAAKAYLEFWAKGRPRTSSSPRRTRVSSRRPTTPTRAATPTLQKKAVEIVGDAQKITQFLDRDTRPRLRRQERDAAASCSDFLENPDQDLAAFQKQIQVFWDSLSLAAA